MPDLVRSITQPRVYRTLLVATLATSLAATAYAIGRLEPAPIAITTPPVIVPAPNVTVMPAAVTVTPAPVAVPAVEPEPEPAPEPKPVPRALVPTLDPACVIVDANEAQPATCAWDSGFPAIAVDGSSIATTYSADAGPSGFYSLTIRFLDPMTSRTVREVEILTEDESAPFVYPDEDPEKADKIQRAIRAKVARRVAALQKTLDTTTFRSLQPLGGWHQNQDADTEPAAPPTDRIYGEITGSAVRIVDPKTQTMLWRGDFASAGPKVSDTDDCSAWSPWSLAAWWDPETRYVFASSSYRTGGCMCPDVQRMSVRRMR